MSLFRLISIFKWNFVIVIMKKKITKTTTSKKLKSGKPKTFTVKIDGSLHEELDNWLNVQMTSFMGYHSKSDFVNQAIRELMKRERGPRFTDLFENKDGDYTLVDTYLRTAENNILVILDQVHKIMKCTYCNVDECDHVLFIWKSISSSSRLSNLGFVCMNEHKRYDYHI